MDPSPTLVAVMHISSLWRTCLIDFSSALHGAFIKNSDKGLHPGQILTSQYKGNHPQVKSNWKSA